MLVTLCNYMNIKRFQSNVSCQRLVALDFAIFLGVPTKWQNVLIGIRKYFILKYNFIHKFLYLALFSNLKS